MKEIAELFGTVIGILDWTIPILSFIFGIYLIYWWLIVPPLLSFLISLFVSGLSIGELSQDIKEVTEEESKQFVYGIFTSLSFSVFNTFLINSCFFFTGVIGVKILS